MWEARLPTGLSRKKPLAMMTPAQINLDTLEFAEKGQLDATLELIGFDTEMDEAGNEFEIYEFRIIEAEKLTPKMTRI